MTERVILSSVSGTALREPLSQAQRDENAAVFSPSLSQHKAWLKQQVDAEAERRQSTLMDAEVGPIKSLIYNGRMNELAALANDVAPQEASYPLLSALIGSDYGSDLASVGAAVSAEANAVLVGLAVIDRQAVLGKAAIDAAGSAADATAAHDAAWP